MSQFECQICLDEFSINDAITLACDHRFCKDCLIGMWKNCIDTSQINEQNLKCPDQKCTQPISYNELKGNLPSDYFQRYEDLSKKFFKQTTKSEIMIQCPTPDCEGYYAIWEDADFFTCQICKKKYCVKCKNLFHGKVSCEDAKTGLSEIDIKEQKILIELGFKKCPHCHTLVEKSNGCNFISCGSGKCQKKFFFCYLCSKPLLETNHFDHFFDEPYGDKCLGNQNLPTNDIDKIKQKEIEIIVKPCPKCKSNDKELVELMDAFNNEFVSCKSQKCVQKNDQPSIYCIHCSQTLNDNNIMPHLDQIENCKNQNQNQNQQQQPQPKIDNIQNNNENNEQPQQKQERKKGCIIF